MATGRLTSVFFGLLRIPRVARGEAAAALCCHHSTSASFTTATSAASLDPLEAAKFAELASGWWDPSGPFAPLHRLNPARCCFIRDAVCSAHGADRHAPEPLLGMHALDVGCGGGILAESLARMGAQVWESCMHVPAWWGELICKQHRHGGSKLLGFRVEVCASCAGPCD